MSLIQKIRDKYARIAVVAIALSLLGFILMDAFAGRTGLFGGDGPSNYIGEINGKEITRASFDARVAELEQQYGPDSRPQIIAGLWDQEVSNTLIEEEAERLGLTVTNAELDDILYGSNPPQFIAQGFTNPQTGKLDAARARQAIAEAQKPNNPNYRYVQQAIEEAKKQRLAQKYMALLVNTVYYPKWFLEKRNADGALAGSASFVMVPYTHIPDSSIKVSDDEIEAYVKEHKERYEVKEESRSITFVAFNAAPSGADSSAAFNTLAARKAAFDTVRVNYKGFLRNEQNFPFLDAYISEDKMQHTNKDSILAQPVGTVYGPYLDVNPQAGTGFYVMSKIIDKKQWPDSAKARHILIGTVTQDQQTGQFQQIRDDSSAKRLADSVLNLYRQGQPFDSLVVRFSDDGGSKTTGGVYENISVGQMVPEFNDFVFGKPVGSMDIVKTQFGYHIIEVLSQKGSSPVYKIAYLTQPIRSSEATNRTVQSAATSFASSATDAKSFNDNADKLRAQGINKMPAMDIKPMDYTITGIPGQSRNLVREIFNREKGDVIGPMPIGNVFIVALVSEVKEPGLMSASAARLEVEPIIRRRKQGEQIIKQMGNVTTLEAVAAKFGQQVSNIDSVGFNSPDLAYEPKVQGAMFNPANKGKVVTEPIAGTSGVFALRVNAQFTKPVANPPVDEQRRMMKQQFRASLDQQLQQGYNPIMEPLKNAAKIKDNRADFY